MVSAQDYVIESAVLIWCR